MYGLLRNKASVLAAVIVVIVLLAVALGACDYNNNGYPSSTSPASCAFIVGDGQAGDNSSLDGVVYPNHSLSVGDGQVAEFIPCNSRNYIINNGTVKNANGKQVGDRFTPTIAYTSTGTAIAIWTSSYWTPNESPEAMKDFYALCLKYTCYSNKDQAGSNDFSTAGWNGLLGENFGSSIDLAGLDAASKIGDAIWQDHSPALYAQLGDAMSQDFDNVVRAKTGYDQNLFCGSGNSGFTSSSDKYFNCTDVRIEVDFVTLAPNQGGSSSSAGQAQVNAERLKNAEAEYGPAASASFWLGLQDTLAACHTGSTCDVYLNTSAAGASAPTIPTSAPTTAPSGH